MKNKSGLVVSTLLTLAVFVALALGNSVGNGNVKGQRTLTPVNSSQKETVAQVELPPGDWRLSSTPTREPQVTADVYSVTLDKARGLTVTKVGVKNRSDKKIVGIRFGWRLFDTEDPQRTLLKGETPILNVTFLAEERQIVEYPVVTFATVYKPLLRKGRLTGNYHIEVSAIEVVFDEKTKISQTTGDQTRTIAAQYPLNSSWTFVKAVNRPDPSPPATIVPKPNM